VKRERDCLLEKIETMELNLRNLKEKFKNATEIAQRSTQSRNMKAN
jgi:hypothetical protein